MAGTVVNDKFQAQNGFESPSFNVDTAGKITGVSLDVQSILLNGKAFVQAETGDTSDDTGTTFTILLPISEINFEKTKASEGING